MRLFSLSLVAFVGCIFFQRSFCAQSLDHELDKYTDELLAYTNALRIRSKFEEVEDTLKQVLAHFDSLNVEDSRYAHRIWLEQGRIYMNKNQNRLGYTKVVAALEASRQHEEWDIYCSAQLRMNNLQLIFGSRTKAKEHLEEAKRFISHYQLKELEDELLYNYASLYKSYGNEDSVRYYLEQLFALPEIDEEIRAEAYALYGTGLRSLPISERERYFRKGITYFKTLENYRQISKIHYDIFYLHQADLTYSQLRQKLDTTIFYCYEGLARDQDTYYTLAKAYQWQAKYLKKLGRFEEAMLSAERGFSQEMRYWQQSERYKAIEAYRVHENEKTEQRLAEQSRLLSIAKKRTLGLTVFTVLILLLSFVTLYIYNQLKKSKEQTEQQAVELERLNGKLANSNTQLEKSLQLQVILKAELKHRVKNNLQLILGLFRRQEKSIDDPILQGFLKQGKEQVQSIALLHQKIDVNNPNGAFDPQSYLTEMMSNIAKSYVSIYPKVKFHLDLNVELIHVDAAVPLGLIMNELVTNAYKYAFPNGGNGNIWVLFSKQSDYFYLKVEDDGVGLPDNIAERREGSLGTQLIKGLVRQLNGTVAWSEAEVGTIVQIKFRGYLNNEKS